MYLPGAILLLVVGQATATVHDRENVFETKIRPVLAGTCFKCHGSEKTSGGLRVDSREALLKGGETGPAIVPGKPEESLLVKALHRGEELSMPPDAALPAPVIEEFANWVRDGAFWPAPSPNRPAGFEIARHWAFLPVENVEPPADASWSPHPVDRFIDAARRQHKITAVAEADRRTLARRLYFDLIGLPPKPEEMAEYLADAAEGAYERLIERLLASPRYGERWGRHWLDLARYADTAGENSDYPVPEARHYRDYVIAAFNADKPYNEFVREQIAGDILARSGPPERHAERVAATGFLALSRRYMTSPYDAWELTLEDTIDTTGRALLGLTLRCARCHDHKFDPTTTADYYALYGIFSSTQFPFPGSEEYSSKAIERKHFVALEPPAVAEPRWKAYHEKLAALEKRINQAESKDPDRHKLWKFDDELTALNAEIDLLEKSHKDATAPRTKRQFLKQDRARLYKALLERQSADHKEYRRLKLRGGPDDLELAYAVEEGKPENAQVQKAGDPDSLGQLVERGVPKFIAGQGAKVPSGTSGRLQLADWLADARNPLVARVMVNRIWQNHFGKGLVATPSNFGLRGEKPTHPELLDWLASEFVRRGWSIKAMHRLIVSSKTYRLASSADATAAEIDPANQWYWRSDIRRLDAEALRDGMLQIAGLLDVRNPGSHPFPPHTEWYFTQHQAFRAVYPSRHRSVYLMTQRIQRHPYLALFDGPDTNSSTDVRTSSTVPLQALFLMNSPFVREQATALAARLIKTTGAAERVALGYRLAWGRDATADEATKASAYIDRYSAELKAAGTPADRIEPEAWTSYAKLLLTANEFLYVN